MNYSSLELQHILAQLESNLIDEGYIISCDIEKVKFDEHNRPFEQTANGRVMLSKKAYQYQVKN
jgi:hypothetical protein